MQTFGVCLTSKADFVGLEGAIFGTGWFPVPAPRPPTARAAWCPDSGRRGSIGGRHRWSRGKSFWLGGRRRRGLTRYICLPYMRAREA